MKTKIFKRAMLLVVAAGMLAVIACERNVTELDSNLYRPSKLTSMSPAEAEAAMPEVGLKIPSNLTDLLHPVGDGTAEITIPEGYSMIAETSEGYMQYDSKIIIGMDCYCLNGNTVCGRVQAVLPNRPGVQVTLPPKVPNLDTREIIEYLTDTNTAIVVACIKTQNSCSGADDPCNVLFSSGAVGEKILDITRAVIIKNED